MYGQEDRRPTRSTGDGVRLAPASVAPTTHLPPEYELAFWKRTAAGLTALAHNNCWMAARALADINANIGGALALTLAPDHTLASEPWPTSPAEARQWLTRLVRGYQETIRLVWEQSRAHDDADTPAYTLSRRCFALIEACERRANAAEDERAAVSWQTCSIVLPAYNEAENIGETMLRCVEALSAIAPNFEVIVVDDGSRDATGAIADAAAADDASITVVHNRPNQGYGGALLAGFAAAQGKRLFFMDSDGQFDISEIAVLLRIVESGQSPIAVGYRAKRSDPFMRKLNAWGWKLAARHIVGLRGIRDIDCAFKLLPTDALRACQLIAQGASVNVEMLLKFQRMGLAIHQTPVRHMPRTRGSPTGAKPAVILRAFRELFYLRRHLRVWLPPRQAMPSAAPLHNGRMGEPMRLMDRAR